MHILIWNGCFSRFSCAHFMNTRFSIENYVFSHHVRYVQNTLTKTNSIKLNRGRKEQKKTFHYIETNTLCVCVWVQRLKIICTGRDEWVNNVTCYYHLENFCVYIIVIALFDANAAVYAVICCWAITNTARHDMTCITSIGIGNNTVQNNFNGIWLYSCYFLSLSLTTET